MSATSCGDIVLKRPIPLLLLLMLLWIQARALRALNILLALLVNGVVV